MDTFSCLPTIEQTTSRLYAKEALMHGAGRTWTQLSMDHNQNYAADFTPQALLDNAFHYKMAGADFFSTDGLRCSLIASIGLVFRAAD